CSQLFTRIRASSIIHEFPVLNSFSTTYPWFSRNVSSPPVASGTGSASGSRSPHTRRYADCSEAQALCTHPEACTGWAGSPGASGASTCGSPPSKGTVTNASEVANATASPPLEGSCNRALAPSTPSPDRSTGSWSGRVSTSDSPSAFHVTATGSSPTAVNCVSPWVTASSISVTVGSDCSPGL